MWLLAASVRQAIEQAQQNGVLPSVEQQAQYEARYGFEEGDTSRVLTVAGDVAEINVTGVMTQRPSFLAMLFGGGNVTYSEIGAALAAVDNDDDIKRVEMVIDSPGGSIDGLFDTIAAMQSFSKPLRATVKNQAASAGYALASQADEIVAGNRASRVGSIGVVASFAVDDSRVDVTSTNAPRKRPDVTTDEGRDMVREEIDALHELFVDAIATGRDIGASKVNAEFGQGSMLLADEALKRGMIDSIAEQPLRVVQSSESNTAAHGGNTSETGPMDLNTLKAQHPDVYAAAVEQGQKEERDRVSAHLEMGEAAGAIDIAIQAIKDGEQYTAKHMASYNAAALRSRDQSNRQADDEGAAAADGAAAGLSDGDAADQVCAIVEASRGIVGGETHG